MAIASTVQGFRACGYDGITALVLSGALAFSQCRRADSGRSPSSTRKVTSLSTTNLHRAVFIVREHATTEARTQHFSKQVPLVELYIAPTRPSARMIHSTIISVLCAPSSTCTNNPVILSFLAILASAMTTYQIEVSSL